MATAESESARGDVGDYRRRAAVRLPRGNAEAPGRSAPGARRLHRPAQAMPAAPGPLAPAGNRTPPAHGQSDDHREVHIVAALARRLGLVFDPSPVPGLLPAAPGPHHAPLLRHLASGAPVSLLPLEPGAPRPRFALAPGRAGAQALVRLVTGSPDLAGRLILTTARGLDAAAARLLEALPPEALHAACAAPLGPDPADPTGAPDPAALAALLDLPWHPQVQAAARMPLPEADAVAAPRGLRIETTAGARIAVAGDAVDPGALAALLRRRPDLRPGLVLSSRQALRDGLLASHGAEIVARDALALARRRPDQSARQSLTPAQARIGATFLASLATTLFLAPALVTTIASLIAATAFLAVAMLRLSAALAAAAPAFHPPRRTLPDPELPAYCVLVPLHREAAALPGLVAALRGLDYPADRLDIKLLIEADDAATLGAARHHAGTRPFDIVCIPAAGPRTKPKALGVGLALTRAELVTVFDAEDRPDPDQLRVAAEIFAAAGPELACVQGRLTIDHVAGGSWIVRLFGLDYAMHFDGLLPFLARCNLLFPLGGTSNHFRRTALEEVHGWDAFNVTEDADLAVRLMRAGYRMTVMASCTREEATETARAWIRQRSRWFKGWIQTWFVHMRAPQSLIAEIGLRHFLAFQVLFPAALATVAAFPAALVLLLLYLAGLRGFGGDEPAAGMLFVLHATSFVGGITAAALLAITSLAARPLPLRRFDALLVVPYWLMMTVALGWAVIDLVRRPHYWDKTEHARAVRPGTGAGGQGHRPPPRGSPDHRS